MPARKLTMKVISTYSWKLDHSKPNEMKFFAFQAKLEDLMKKKVDLVSTDRLSLHARPFVDRDKTLIYERGK